VRSQHPPQPPFVSMRAARVFPAACNCPSTLLLSACEICESKDLESFQFVKHGAMKEAAGIAIHEAQDRAIGLLSMIKGERENTYRMSGREGGGAVR
jgi:hypothetical protein